MSAKRPTTVNFRASWERMRAGRVRILWLVLGALLLVSALPIGLYHRQVLQLSQDKLIDNERVQQTDLTRSLPRNPIFRSQYDAAARQRGPDSRVDECD